MGIAFGAGKEIKAGGGINTRDLEINLSKLAPGEKIKVRLVGDVEPNFRFWTTTREGKKKPKLTPFFNKETESFDSGDPLLGQAQKEFFYTVNCIDRSSGELKILILKTTVYRYLYSLATDDDYGNPADPVGGYDINITKEKTGPQAQNVKYNCSPSLKQTPLTDQEKELKLHDLASVYDPGTKEEYLQWVKENTTYLDDDVPYGDVGDKGHDKDDDIPF
jgi:hypothetical protein